MSEHTIPPALLVATMDTKKDEAFYLKACLEEAGVQTLIMDAGIMGNGPTDGVTVTRHEVARAAGRNLNKIRSLSSEGEAMNLMVTGATHCALSMYGRNEISGIIGIGGSMGTTLGTGIMRSMPIGFPKVMISSVASRDTRPFVGTRDICMLYSVSDIGGLNRVTRRILKNGAYALAGMVVNNGAVTEDQIEDNHHLAVLSALGTSEACVAGLRKKLTEKGVEVITFHTTGSGGEAMEKTIREQKLSCVLDLSLHELIDHHFGGDYDAGPNRCKAILQTGVPTIFVPGNIDFLVTGPIDKAEKQFPGRRHHMHNAHITCVRTVLEEVRKIGEIVADLCNKSTGRAAVLVPELGFSGLDREGAPLHNPEGPKVFFDAVKKNLKKKGAPVVDTYIETVPCHINDKLFVDAVINAMAKITKIETLHSNSNAPKQPVEAEDKKKYA